MEKPSVTTTVAAGSLAGAAETIVTVSQASPWCYTLIMVLLANFLQYPAEFVKTRRQLPSTNALSSFAILRNTFSSSGLRGLYSGCSALAISNAAKSGLRFYTFETARSKLPTLLPSLAQSSMLNVYAGLCAGVVESVLVVTPGEAIKTQMIHAAAHNGATSARPSLPRVVHTMVRQHGLFSLWKGVGPVLCKQSTNSAVRFATFGVFRDFLSTVEAIRSRIGKSGTTFLAGAGSGVVTVYASMPFDNVKTRMQSIGSIDKNMLACARSMLRNEGVRVFWKATTPRLVRLTLSSSITFTVYDWVVSATAKFSEPGTRMGVLKMGQ